MKMANPIADQAGSETDIVKRWFEHSRHRVIKSTYPRRRRIAWVFGSRAFLARITQLFSHPPYSGWPQPFWVPSTFGGPQVWSPSRSGGLKVGRVSTLQSQIDGPKFRRPPISPRMDEQYVKRLPAECLSAIRGQPCRPGERRKKALGRG